MATTSSSVLVHVSCLACGETYPKPVGGGTVRANPGCPSCGYLGWAVLNGNRDEAGGSHRSASDPPPDPSSRSG